MAVEAVVGTTGLQRRVDQVVVVITLLGVKHPINHHFPVQPLTVILAVMVVEVLEAVELHLVTPMAVQVVRGVCSPILLVTVPPDTSGVAEAAVVVPVEDPVE
tara:strand:- start:240 stop:548 length:309 start_codon:yes stop_codon:yes gene_type:complete